MAFHTMPDMRFLVALVCGQLDPCWQAAAQKQAEDNLVDWTLLVKITIGLLKVHRKQRIGK
jgi:hypothetical protein